MHIEILPRIKILRTLIIQHDIKHWLNVRLSFTCLWSKRVNCIYLSLFFPLLFKLSSRVFKSMISILNSNFMGLSFQKNGQLNKLYVKKFKIFGFNFFITDSLNPFYWHHHMASQIDQRPAGGGSKSAQSLRQVGSYWDFKNEDDEGRCRLLYVYS